MIRLLAIFFLLLLASGCSDSNGGAPDLTEAHPDDWIFTHPEPARDSPDRCRSCHGANFEGRDEAVSCFTCHPFGMAPQVTGSFTVHPPSWGANVVLNHQDFPLEFNWTTCANGSCHGANLRGGLTGPSCFLAGCHLQGPPASHPVESFILPQQHGVAARDGLFFCFNCHGRPPADFDGGYVTDPAILGDLGGNCSICHPSAQAHPTNWQGTNDLPGDTDTRDARSPTHSSSHRGVNAAAVPSGCALCHNISAPGAGAVATAPSCFAPSFTNAEGSATGCHAGGPGSVPHPVGQQWLLPSGHVAAAQANSQTCIGCHVTGNVSPNCRACHLLADPLATGGCASCHGTPPNGNAAPNRALGHAIGGHQSFIGTCANCHQGVGSGTVQHFDRAGGTGATPALPAEVVPSGQAPFNFTYTPATRTCSNIACHGNEVWQAD